jgi:H+/Na+-translocating ferredoxin:NAD+ oxidoreductase subunit B
MDANSIIIPALVIGGLALACGLIIYFINAAIKNRVKNADIIEKVAKALPGTDCGACGYDDCYAYARSLADSPGEDCPVCPAVLASPDSSGEIEQALGMKLDKSDRKAVVLCAGRSENLFDYSGIKSCQAATELLGGFKKCPFSCLGLGDCIGVCQPGAISIDRDMGIAVVDWNKCNGCGVCVTACPKGIIRLTTEDEKTGFPCGYKQDDIPGRERCEQARKAAV